MKIFLTLILAITIAECCAQSDYKKSWSKDSPLIWDDFKGPIDDTSEFKALTHFNELYTYKWNLVDGKYLFKFEVTSVMDQGLSWSKADSQTPALLKHEQIHFDISEFFARKLLFAFNHYTFTKEFKDEIAAIAKDYDKLRGVMEVQYDNDTRHGMLKRQQLAWENYVAELLNQDYPLEEAMKSSPSVKR